MCVIQKLFQTRSSKIRNYNDMITHDITNITNLIQLDNYLKLYHKVITSQWSIYGSY